MKKYDIKEILSKVSLEDMLERYGWETERKGRYTMVLCKFHNDTKFGSAMIYPDNPDYFMCFTCGQRYNIFDVYMYEHNCDFAEALNGIASEYGIKAEKTSKKEIRMPFTRKELSEIGLCMYDRKQESYIEGYLGENEDISELKKNGYRVSNEVLCPNTYALQPLEYDISYKARKGESQMEHLCRLFRDDRSTFKYMVLHKAREAEERHTKNYLMLRAVSEELAFRGTSSNLTDALLFLSLHGMYTSQKIIRTLQRL